MKRQSLFVLSLLLLVSCGKEPTRVKKKNTETEKSALTEKEQQLLQKLDKNNDGILSALEAQEALEKQHDDIMKSLETLEENKVSLGEIGQKQGELAADHEELEADHGKFLEGQEGIVRTQQQTIDQLQKLNNDLTQRLQNISERLEKAEREDYYQRLEVLKKTIQGQSQHVSNINLIQKAYLAEKFKGLKTIRINAGLFASQAQSVEVVTKIGDDIGLHKLDGKPGIVLSTFQGATGATESEISRFDALNFLEIYYALLIQRIEITRMLEAHKDYDNTLPVNFSSISEIELISLTPGQAAEVRVNFRHTEAIERSYRIVFAKEGHELRPIKGEPMQDTYTEIQSAAQPQPAPAPVATASKRVNLMELDLNSLQISNPELFFLKKLNATEDGVVNLFGYELEEDGEENFKKFEVVYTYTADEGLNQVSKVETQNIPDAPPLAAFILFSEEAKFNQITKNKYVGSFAEITTISMGPSPESTQEKSIIEISVTTSAATETFNEEISKPN